MRKAILVLLLLNAPLAFAAEPPKLDPANTAWMLTASVLVLFMTLPGLALFYAGLVRTKNVLSVLMQCFAITCLVTLAWVAIGYSIAFGEGNAWWGGLGKMFFSGIDVKTVKGSIPETVFAMYQLTFAIITPALVIGGAAGVACFLATSYMKRALNVDDSLDVFPVHGVGGALGTLLTGIFVSAAFGGIGYPEKATMGEQF